MKSVCSTRTIFPRKLECSAKFTAFEERLTTLINSYDLLAAFHFECRVTNLFPIYAIPLFRLRIAIQNISSMKISIGIPGLGIGCWVIEIAFHNRWTSHANLTTHVEVGNVLSAVIHESKQESACEAKIYATSLPYLMSVPGKKMLPTLPV